MNNEKTKNFLDNVSAQEHFKIFLSLMRDTHEASSTEGSLALVHVLENTSLETWEKLCVEHQLCDIFFPVPISQSIAETLSLYQERFDKLSKDSTTDALTKIFNRRYFDQVLQTEFERSIRSHADLSLVLFDIDNFKQVNDTYGHSCGDIVLQHLAKVITENARRYDIAARIGGEEFALLLPSTTVWKAQRVAMDILVHFRQISFSSGEHRFSVSFSAGLASVGILDAPINPMHLFNTADQALYAAKNAGKNQTCIANTQRLQNQSQSLVHQYEKKLLFSFKAEE